MPRGVLSILAVGAAAALAWLLLADRTDREEPRVTALVREPDALPTASEPDLAKVPELALPGAASPPAIDADAPAPPAAGAAPADAGTPAGPGARPEATTPVEDATATDAASPVLSQDEPEDATAGTTEQPAGETAIETPATVALPPAEQDAATAKTLEPTGETAAETLEMAALPPAEQDAATAETAEPTPATPPTAAESEAASDPPAGTPVFDVVRVSPDGQVVVAGRAEPGATVEVLVEGEVAGEVEADSAGAFVAVLETQPSDEAREMILRVETPPEADSAEEAVPTDAAPAPDRQEEAAEAAAEAPASAPQYLASAPVIILPGSNPAAAPVLVRTDEAEVDVVQPAPLTQGERMALDRITYEAGGDVIAAGRGEQETAVRTYANGILVSEAAVAESGGWQATIPGGIAAQAELLRFDAITPSGQVTGRIETPFDYQSDGADLAVRDRKVVIQRGNNLWRLAEQHYGQGIRYSLIFSANAELIRDPDLIYPGQVFSVPELVDSE